ncbi:MAG: long-chain fatty acid--CoA ligase [Spirochaetes bacterium]|nr:MAG: long-chain fatty acid--CoA ligase [Spirochaetota bacterium]
MGGDTIIDIFLDNALAYPHTTILKFKKNKGADYSDVTWKELRETTMAFACGLAKLGMKTADRMAILSSNRYEWIIADLGCMMMGGADVPVYHTNTPDQCAYIIRDSGSKYVVVEDELQLAKVLSKGKGLGLKKIILIHGKRPKQKNVISYSDLLEIGRKSFNALGGRIEKIARSIDPSKMATIVYTSGTTGPPKGCMVSHGNTVYVLKSIDDLIRIDPESNLSLMVLPLSHFYPRISGYYYNIFKNVPFAVAESIDTLAKNMMEVRPTYFTSVPRIFEKVHGRILNNVKQGSPLKRMIFSFAVTIGTMRSRGMNSKGHVSILLSLAFSLADLLVFKKIRDLLGGQLRFAVSAGAPLSAAVGEFIHSIGIQVIEFYGLTETLGGTMTTFEKCRYGTVGMPMPGFEVKIADDGEILIHGNNFLGYCNKPSLTKEILQGGWCYTGDIGYWDADGFLVINDRKKDLIVTSGGKKISPQNIENMLKKIPMVSNAMVYGDRKNYLTALITLDMADTKDYAKRHNIPGERFENLILSHDILRAVQKGIDRINENLAKYESIKKFIVLPREFLQEEGEITPTLKIKRKNITERFKNEISSMYGGDNQSAS